MRTLKLTLCTVALWATAFLASTSYAQLGVCKTGNVCTPYAVRPNAVPYASLPACNTARKGWVMNDSTNNCLTRCDGTAWACMNYYVDGGVTMPLSIANGGTNGSATPTAGGIVAGNGTRYVVSAAATDAGMVLVPGNALNVAPVWSGAPVVSTLTCEAPSGSVAVKASTDGACYQIGSDVFIRRSSAGVETISQTCADTGNATLSSGTFSSLASGGTKAVDVTVANARIQHGPGLNCWSSSDGGLLHFECGLDININTTSTMGSLIVGGTLLRFDGALTGTSTSNGISYSAAGVPVLVTDVEGLRLQGAATMTTYDAGLRGTLQYDTATDQLKVALADGGWKIIQTLP